MLPSMGLKIGGFWTVSGVVCSSQPGAPWILSFSAISHIVLQQMEMMRRKDKGHSLTFYEVTL